MTIRVELTNMCMVMDGTKILVQNRLDPIWHGITFPGGHVEPGESFAEAVIREVYEETGLTITEPKLCGVKQWLNQDGSRVISFLYLADRFAGELKSSDEGEVFWAEKSNLTKMDLASGMEETIKVFFDNNITELSYSLRDPANESPDWHYEDWKYTLN
nr:8-oxo-dGTP diphosphatase [uncultured Acetatifactor sp.]